MHPGGRSVFTNGNDLTDDFEAVGHSKHAKSTLKTLAVDYVAPEGNEEQHPKSSCCVM